MKILVTGSTGFLGSHLMPHLRDRGHCVGCLVHDNSTLQPEPSDLPTWRVGVNGSGFCEALTEFMPDVVVHLAALYVAEHRYEDVGPLVQANVEFGAYLLDAMGAAGCDALVYAGTSWQHYHDRNYCPVNLYAATKQAFSTLAEYYLDAAGLRLLELHLYDSYGEDDPRNKLLSRLQAAAESSDEFAMSEGAQRLHLVHVADLVRGVAMACEQVQTFKAGERRIYRLPSAKAVSLRELVAMLNVSDQSHPVRVRWGTQPYRRREVFQPWEGAEVLPGWLPEISLEGGLRRLRGAGSRVAK
ncbi:NAD(P)-dependent oxidoreductase [Candidatus Methylomirabilis sp.]|uniref:NAD-dependent epimerase/dehydratase family protein n=1 Tax=Candidatus Methylomirabilis sp. TaxID=2032687 RepID=UPI002A672668|nr:NAD(P)-dependent oxidoreductase [Candidatus Methylomirabilis sp.]